MDWKNKLPSWAIKQHFLPTKVYSPLVSLNIALISNNSAALTKKKKSPFLLARWITGRLFPHQGQCGFVSSRRGRFAIAKWLLPIVNTNRGVPKSQHWEKGAGWGEEATTNKLEKMTLTPHRSGRGQTTAMGKRPLVTTGMLFSSSSSRNKHSPMNCTSAN